MLITHVHASQVPNRTQTVRTQLQCRYIDVGAIFSGVQACPWWPMWFLFLPFASCCFLRQGHVCLFAMEAGLELETEGPSVGEITNPEVPLPFRPTLCLTLPSTPPHRLPRTHTVCFASAYNRLPTYLLHILLIQCRRRPRRAQHGAATLSSVPAAPPSTLRVTIAQGSDSPQPSD